jgi:hypothetical protein
MEVKHSSEAIWILSPSTAITCSLRGTVVEALHNPMVETNVMSEFLVEALLGKIPLVSTNKLFKSPSGLIFEFCGIAKAMPVIIGKTEVILDYHIFAILEFNLLIGYPLEKLFQEKSFHGSLDEKLGKTASATHLETPMVEHHPNHDPLEETKFISPFVSPRFSSETECPLLPSLEPEPCPSGYPNIVLENKNFCAMDIHVASTLETKEINSIDKHESFSFETPHVSCSLLESLEFILLKTTCPYEDPKLLLLLISKLFRRMVVDAFMYHKYCKSHNGIVVLTLQLEHIAKCLVVKLGTIPPLIAAR